MRKRECVDAYCQLEGEEQQEYERLLLTSQFTEANMLAKTTFEKGIEQAAGKLRAEILDELQANFPAVLSPDVRQILESQSDVGQLIKWLRELSRATTAEQGRQVFFLQP